jgi:hypothetical protein
MAFLNHYFDSSNGRLVKRRFHRRYSLAHHCVGLIREMFGLLTAERADEAIIVTSGKFTAEAESFAQGRPIQLVDGQHLLQLVKQVQPGTPASSTIVPTEADAPPFCPFCGKAMDIRIVGAVKMPATSFGAARIIRDAGGLVMFEKFANRTDYMAMGC